MTDNILRFPSRPADPGESEIGVTDDMLNAGLRAYQQVVCGGDPAEVLLELLSAVYHAMDEARTLPRKEPQDVPPQWPFPV